MSFTIKGYIDVEEDSGLGISVSARLHIEGKNGSIIKSLSNKDQMKVGDWLKISVHYKTYVENNMTWFKQFKRKMYEIQTRYNYHTRARGRWQGCLRPSKFWNFLPSTLQALALAPTSAGVNLSPPEGEKCRDTTKVFRSFVEKVVEKTQVEQAKAAWLNVVNFRCNERNFNSEKPWMMNETKEDDQNHREAYLDMVETGRGPFSEDKPECRQQVMNLIDLLHKSDFSFDVIYSLLTGGLDASRGKLYNIRKTLNRPLSFWLGFARQDTVNLAKNSNMTDMTYLLHEDLPLGSSANHAQFVSFACWEKCRSDS